MSNGNDPLHHRDLVEAAVRLVNSVEDNLDLDHDPAAERTLATADMYLRAAGEVRQWLASYRKSSSAPSGRESSVKSSGRA